MSQSRQPYVTLKQFIEQLQKSPSPSTHLRIMNYWRVTFAGNSQSIDDVDESANWNAVNLESGEALIPVKDLVDHLTKFVHSHPDAAVTVRRNLVDHFVWMPMTKSGLFKDTLLNKPPAPISVDDFVAGLNALKVDGSDLALNLMTEKFPGKPVTLYCVDSTWLTKDDLHAAYPKLSNYSYPSLFNTLTSGHNTVLYCKIGAAKMKESFGRAEEDLIERLLKESVTLK
jgi:hypothetical protein